MATVRGANGVDYKVHLEGDDVRVYRGDAQLFIGRITRDRMVGFVAGRTLPADVMEQVCAIACPPIVDEEVEP